MKSTTLVIFAFIGCALSAPTPSEEVAKQLVDWCFREQVESYDALEVPESVGELVQKMRRENPGQKLVEVDYDLVEKYKIPDECHDFAPKVEQILTGTPICKLLDEEQTDQVVDRLIEDERYDTPIGAARACFAGERI